MSLPAPAAPGVTGIPQIPGLTREERRSRPSGSRHTNSPGDVPSSGARQGPPVLQPGERAPGRDVMSLGTMGSAPEPPHPASSPFSPSLRSQGATSGEDLAPAWVFEGSFPLAGRSRSWQRAELILHGMSAFAPAPLCSSQLIRHGHFSLKSCRNLRVLQTWSHSVSASRGRGSLRLFSPFPWLLYSISHLFPHRESSSSSIQLWKGCRALRHQLCSSAGWRRFPRTRGIGFKWPFPIFLGRYIPNTYSKHILQTAMCCN